MWNTKKERGNSGVEVQKEFLEGFTWLGREGVRQCSGSSRWRGAKHGWLRRDVKDEGWRSVGGRVANVA